MCRRRGRSAGYGRAVSPYREERSVWRQQREGLQHANLIWGIAELLRGDYKRADYGKVILPLVVMRRLDQVLEERRDAVIEQANERGRQAASTVTTSRRRSRPSKSDGFRV